MKVLIFDSGTLINLSMNGLLNILKDLKKGFDGKFIITPAVKYEVIDRPSGVPRFELGALMVQNLIDSGVIELSSSLNVDESAIKQDTQDMLDLANHYVQVKGKWISIVSEAEISCLALSNELTSKGVENMIAIDERTTRVLGENPESLQKLISERLHSNVHLVAHDMRIFSHYKFIRSSELVYVAFKKGLIPLKGKNALEALLYATKYKGSAISFEEIDELKRL